MYGKHFSSMYEGSMVGAGSHVFAVWGYVISKADPEAHTIDLNPMLISCIIGDSVERVKSAITFLCKPDPDSHCGEHDGARLLHQGGHTYFVVTHEHYRAIGNNQDARDYFREAKRRQRAKEEGLSKTVKDNLGQSKTPASVYASDSGTEQEGGCKGGCERNANASDTHKPSLCSPQPQPEPDIQKPETMKKDVVLSDFEEAWKAYPSKTGSKTTSEKAYRRYRKDGDAQVDILAGIDRYKRHVEAQRIGGFALNWQNGQTFFNGAGWRSSWTTEAFKLVPGQPSAEWETAKKQIAELVWTARDAERAGDKDAITRAIKTCRDKYRDVPKRGDSHVVTVAVELAMNNSRR